MKSTASLVTRFLLRASLLGALGAGLAMADVSVDAAPSTVSPSATVQISYSNERNAPVFFFWAQGGRIVKVERGVANQSQATLQAPGVAGTFQLYVYSLDRRGRPELSAPRQVVVADTPTQPTPTQPTPTQPTQPTKQRFEVTVENVGGAGPLAPGAFALHRGQNPIHRSGQRAGRGLEALAEDGNPVPLEQELSRSTQVLTAGVFNTPLGAGQAGPAMPGQSYRFVVEADPRDGARLSLATMLAQTNDTFVSPAASIALFNGQGQALGERTFGVVAYDAGTEANQAFGQGPDQAPRQAGPNTGGAEGTLRMWSDSTRALPQASQLVSLSVRRRGGSFEVTLRNLAGTFVSPVTPVFHVAHDGSYELFRDGEAALGNGLEALAEDGDASQLRANARNTSGVSASGVAGQGPLTPGSSVKFTVRPGANATHLTLATMVARTNDAFLAARKVSLVDGRGRVLSAAALEAALNAALGLYDAGTEANQAPGVGGNIAPLQGAPNTGPADADATVRPYADATNDFAGPNAGGFARLAVRHLGNGRFELSLSNTSAGKAFPGQLTTPVVFSHSQGAAPYSPGTPASRGVAELAKDGGSRDFRRELSAQSGVGNIATGFRVTIQLDRRNRFVNLATMIVPSNDAFLALGQGLALLDSRGRVRSSAAIARDAAALLRVYDAGAEANEAGGAGLGQPPLAHGEGNAEGRGRVRRYADPSWALPATDEAIRIRIKPIK